MWKLVHVKKEFLEKYIFAGEETVVGRKECTLLINNDPSISRKHAILYVKHPERNLSNPTKKSSLFIRDEGSKYGTFKNDVRISNEIELSENDVVKFGQFQSEYRVHYTPLVVTTSCLAVSVKKELKATIHLLGGHLVSEWHPSCTHLVMSEVKVTVKAVCCLVSLNPIVTPEYFTELKNSLKSNDTFVLPKRFIPPIGESLIDNDVVSFDVDARRKTLFKEKTFFFLDEKQFKKLHLGITLGGGTAAILNKEKFQPDLLLRKDCCIIEPVKEFQASQEASDVLKPIKDLFEEHNVRMIPESDIGLSVAYCSINKFCNPQFQMGQMLRSQQLQSQTLTQREMYVPDTREASENLGPRRSVADCISSLNFTSFQCDGVQNMEVSEIPLSAEVKNELDDLFDDVIESKAESSSRMDTLPATLALESPVRTPKHEKEVVPSVVNETTLKLPEQRKRNTRQNPSSSSNKRNDDSDNEIKPSILMPTRSKKKSEEQTLKRHNEDIEYDSAKENAANLSPENNTKRQNSEHGKQKKVKEKEETPFLSPPKNKIDVSKLEPPSPPETNGYHVAEEVNLPRNLAKIEFAALICRKPVAVDQTFRNTSVKNFKKFRKVYPKKAPALPRIIGAHELIVYDKVIGEVRDDNVDEPSQEISQPVRGEFDW